ncbi:MAG: hypothetical protein ABIO93_17345 [Dyadobacter sp.]
MNQILITILRLLFGSVLAIATIVTTTILSPFVLTLWIWKKLTDFTSKK